MTKYQQLVMSDAISKMMEQLEPLKSDMTNREREKMLKVVEIVANTFCDAITAMSEQPTEFIYRQPTKKSALDRVMNNLTFGLWD